MLDNKKRNNFKQAINLIKKNYSEVCFECRNDDVYSVIDSILLDIDIKFFKNKLNQQNRITKYWQFLDEEINLEKLIKNIEKEDN